MNKTLFPALVFVVFEDMYIKETPANVSQDKILNKLTN